MRLERLESDRGVSLMELLIAVTLLSVAFVALISGMFTATVSSDLHRRQTTAGTVVRSYAESIVTETYVSCATTGSYGSSYSPPSGYTTSITTVEYFAANASAPAVGVFQGSCPSTDQGLQRLSLQAASSDGRATETLVIVKRCSGTRPTTCS